MELNIISKFNNFTNKLKERIGNNTDKDHINILNYVEMDLTEDENILSNKQTKRLNSLYNKVLNTVYSKINPKNTDIKTFSDYMYSNEMCQRIFNLKEQNKIKNYLNRYFLIRKIPVLNKINKNYPILNNYMSEIENITNTKINSYNEFLIIGKTYYNTNIYKTVKEKKVINNNDNKQKEETKKVIISKENNSTKEVDELKSTRRKLLNRIKKLENNLTEINDINDDTHYKVRHLRHEIKMCKLAIYSLEEDMLNEKRNNEVFEKRIINNYDVRYDNSLKSVLAYIRKYNNRSINCSIKEYFGIDQVNYFKSLGIDINSMLNEKIKVRRKK